jgi:hypothetical protein
VTGSCEEDNALPGLVKWREFPATAATIYLAEKRRFMEILKRGLHHGQQFIMAITLMMEAVIKSTSVV